MVDTPTTVTYCSVDDVRRVLQSAVKFADDTTPTNEEVRKFITAAESEINKRTRHSWKTVTVTNEFYDLPPPRSDFRNGVPIFLRHRAIKDLSHASNDKVEVWDGSQYTDWLDPANGKTNDRAGDFWLDPVDGILYLFYYSYYIESKAVRVTYRYGETVVPEGVRDAAAFLAAADLILDDDKVQLLNETGNQGFQMTVDMKAKAFENRAERKLKDYMEYFSL